MKITLNQEAINQISSLLNELPIKCFATAQAISKILEDNKHEEPITTTDSD